MFKFFKPRRNVFGVWFFVCFVFAVGPVFADKNAPQTAARSLSFQIAVECNCASCVFETQRDLKKFAGVKSAKFNGKTHRVDVIFEENARPVSELAHVVQKSDLGKGATLCWNVPANIKAENLTKALLNVAGVQSAKSDKSGALLLAFKDTPAVSLKQLDDATQSATTGASHEN